MPDTCAIDLVEFSFVSKVAAGLPAASLLRLARQSWSFNRRMGLTGELRLLGDGFAEEIEGPCEVVQALAARILADERHGSIRISAFRRLAARRHSGWSTSGFDLALGMAPDCATLASGTIRVLRPAALPQALDRRFGLGAGLA